MDTIEKGIIDIDEHTKSAINKHNELFAKTLFESANKSIKSSNSLDSNYKKIFNELDTIGKLDNDLFNPDTVVEFRDGKSYQVIESWDEIDGILPNRKVMGIYYVDEVKLSHHKSNIIYCSTHKQEVEVRLRYNNNRNSEAKSRKQMINNHNGNGNCDVNYSCSKFSCGCNYNTISGLDRIHFIDDENYAHDRGEMRNTVLLREKTEQFEVDNYLNLYHKSTGLYLMFHKTSFPEVCFYLAREYTQLPGKDYYQIYLSKRLEKITVQLHQIHYHSKDNRDKLLESINQLVPDTYHRTYQLYNNFRKMQTFEANDELQINTSTSIDILDSKDRLIIALREKLNTTISRCEKNESIMSEIMEQFTNKSNQVLEIEREKCLLEEKINKIQQEAHLDYLEKIEDKEKKLMNIYKRLNEAETFKTKCESIGISMDTLTKNLEKETLEKCKIRDINAGLINQIRSEKERSDKLMKDNEELLKQIKISKTSLEDNTIKIDKLTKQLYEKNTECSILSDQIFKSGELSNNVLENALSDRVSELEKQLEKAIEENRELERTNEKTNKQNMRIMNIISSLSSI